MPRQLFQKGRTKTGGRKKGVLNRPDTPNRRRREESRKVKKALASLVSQEEIELAIARIPTLGPLDVMLMGMHLRLARGDLDGAINIAGIACPFTSPKLNMAEVTVRHGSADRSDESITAEIAALRLKIEAAKKMITVDKSDVVEVIDTEPALPNDNPVLQDCNPVGDG
jgi:hypothetical protein